MNTIALISLLVFVVAASCIAYLWGHERGRDAVYEEMAEASRDAERAREKIDEEVKGRDDAAVDRDLDKWMRD
jgi:hypothetical protein